MKGIRNWLCLVLVAILSLLPMSGLAESAMTDSVEIPNDTQPSQQQTLAESAQMGTVRISDVHLELGDEETFDIPLDALFTLGADAERFYMDIDAKLGTDPVFKGTIAAEDGLIKMAMDGLSSNYTVSQADLEKMMTDSMTSGSMSADDMAELQRLIMEYPNLIKMLSDEQAMGNLEALTLQEMFGEPISSHPEQVEVFGEVMPMTRYEYILGLEDIDSMYSTALDKMPGIKEWFSDYIALLEKMSGEQLGLDIDHLFTSSYRQTGLDVIYPVTIWMDEAERNGKMDMWMIDTFDAASGNKKLRAVPYHMQFKTEGDIQTMEVVMKTNGISGEVMETNVQMEMNLLQPTMIDMDMSIAVGLFDQNDNMTMNISNKHKGETPEEGFDMALSMEGMIQGQRIALEYAIDNVGENSKLSMDLYADLDELLVIDFKASVNITVSEGAQMPDVLLDLSDKPVLDALSMTDEEGEKLIGELTTAGIIAYGTFMKDPAIAKLIGKAVSGMASITNTYTQTMQTTVA